MSEDYITRIASAHSALDAALDAMDNAKGRGVAIHPSIVNNVITAKHIMAEVLEDVQKSDLTCQENHVVSSDSCLLSPSCNTEIEYLYRDANNYKVWNQCVISGVLTSKQKEEILSCLDEGVYFIPRLVGLPETQFDQWDEQSDHPWFELGEHSFSETIAAPTVEITADELTAAFARCKNAWTVSEMVAQNVCSKPSFEAMISSAKERKPVLHTEGQRCIDDQVL